MRKKAESLFKNEMTQHIIDKIEEKKYFSGKEKIAGEKFFLGCLLLEEKDNIEIVIDICERDIEDRTYELYSIKVNGLSKVGYFTLSNKNSHINKNIKDILKKLKAEERLEQIKNEIEEEIKNDK